MAPPPVTPTPRKFLVPNKRSSSASQQQQQVSGTRNNETTTTTTPGPLLPQSALLPPSPQFRATPRFSLRSTPRASGLSSQQQYAPSTPAAVTAGATTAATTSSSSSTPGTLLLHHHHQQQQRQQSSHTARFREDLIVDSSPPLLPSPDDEGEVVVNSSASLVVGDDDDDDDDDSGDHDDDLSHRVEEDVDLIRDSSPPLTLSRGKREEVEEDEGAEVKGPQSESDDDRELRSPSPKRRRRASSIVVSSSGASDVESLPQRGKQQQHDWSNVKLEDSDSDADDFTHTPTRIGEKVGIEEGEEEEGMMDIDREEKEKEEEDTDNSAFSSSSSSSLPSYRHRHNHHHRGTPTAAQQPTFRPAPRFKPPELSAAASAAAGHRDPLPDVFSPQHRRRGGQRYVPGGMAAEVRDWLVAVEAGSKAMGSGGAVSAGPKRGVVAWRKEEGEGEDGGASGEWVTKIAVDEVRAAPGMVLVGGRRWQQQQQEQEEAVEDPTTIQVVLAGPGRLVGLARRNEVAAGTVVGIARPTWEVELQGLGVWTVACDWIVLA